MFLKILKFIKQYALPFAMIIGGIFHNFFIKLAPITPFLIFFMLFFPYCKIQVKDLKFSRFHLYLLGYQILGSIAAYVILHFFSEQAAQGTLICMMAPTATAAIVIGGMLGANMAVMASYTLFCNLAVAVMAPIMFSFIGIQTEIFFWESFWLICKKVIPLLVFPFLAAQLLKIIAPKAIEGIKKVKRISFYLWIVALTIVTSRIVDLILKQDEANYRIDLILAGISLIICVFQFVFGRFIGRTCYKQRLKKNEVIVNDEDMELSCGGLVVSGGQSLGQKNTILAIWMAQTYLDPVAAIAPGCYVLWQNIINSYQLWLKEHHKDLNK